MAKTPKSVLTRPELLANDVVQEEVLKKVGEENISFLDFSPVSSKASIHASLNKNNLIAALRARLFYKLKQTMASRVN